MAILKKLLNLLEKGKVKYELLKHKTVFTAADLAATLRIKPREVVKTLVVKVGAKDYVLALLPADKKLDLERFKKAVNAWLKKIGKKPVEKIELASERWMKKNISGQVGATPPFGSLFKLPTFVDRALLRTKKIIIQAGDYSQSLRIPTKQLEKIEKFIKGSFSRVKKKIAKK